jgi:hypothetical protein
MNTDGKRHNGFAFLICVHLCSSVALILIAGCSGKPNSANIALREKNQGLSDQIAQLNRQHDADVATINSLQQSKGTLPTLPQDRLDRLFTAHGLRFGRLTGGVRLNPRSSGDDAIKVYIVPTDDAGEPLKAAGSFVVEAFDLDEPSSPRVGHWEFGADESRKNWFGAAMLYNYVLTCPLSTSPKHAKLTLKVAFVDELTSRRFEAQKVIGIALPERSGAATQARQP